MATAALEITADNFEEVVLKSDKAVLVDFWAAWCHPCFKMGPDVERVAREFEGRAIVGKVDVGDWMELANFYGISALPTTLVFKNGEVVENHVGKLSRAELARILEKHV